MGLRRGWLFLVAVALQLGAGYAQRTPVGEVLRPWLLASSYGLLAIGVLSNLGFWGFRLFLVGLVLNVLAIGLNGWRMPVSPEAISQAGLSIAPGAEAQGLLASAKQVVVGSEHVRLWFLTDVLAIRWPVARVLSVGDLFIYVSLPVIAVELLTRWRRGDMHAPLVEAKP